MKIFLTVLIAILIIIGLLALAVGISAFEGWIFMLLWNYVLCAIFPSIPILSFWLAWGLAILNKPHRQCIQKGGVSFGRRLICAH